MRETYIKQLIRTTYFSSGTLRRIGIGPLRGFVFKSSAITGMSPWYSGTERAHQDTFRALLKRGDVAIDIGANWGLHTLYLSRIAQNIGRVIALEPYPPAFAELAWHLSANHRANVLPLPVAASDQNGETLFHPGENASTGRLDNEEARTGPTMSAIPVKARTLDMLCQVLGLKRLDLVKVDVEGAESRVLTGAEATIAQFRPFLIIDLHTPQQDLQVARWLTERGYRLERIEGPPILKPTCGWPDPQGVWGSILAVPI